MDDQIKQISHRLRGLREALEISAGQLAHECNIPLTEYQTAESGTADISVSMLQKIARKYNIALDALMFGEEPKMTGYFVTRADTGISVERTEAYKYQSLAAGFKQRRADPFIVTVEPKGEDEPVHFNAHVGQEFNYILQGRMKLFIRDREIILEEGDSIYFDSNLPHAMRAQDGKTVRFLAFIL